jgi:hypothetical protein
LLTLTLVLALAAAGCAGPAGSTRAAPSPTTAAPTPSATDSPTPPQPPSGTATPPPSNPEPPILPPASGPPKQPTDVFKPVTVSGVVRVSGNCRQLITDLVTWTLLGPSAATLTDGSTVELTGLPHPGLETGCSGSPLQVRSIRSR